MAKAKDDAGRYPGGSVHPATALLRRLVEVTRDFEERLEEELSVNTTDLNAMRHLIQHGPIGPGKLADLIHLSPAATTTVVDRLESLGHVLRRPHPTDRRRTLVEATPRSRKKAEAILWEMIDGIDRVARELDPEAQNTVVAYLGEVVSRYERASARTPTG